MHFINIKHFMIHSMQVKEYAKTILGFTKEEIDGTKRNCRVKECELGKLLTRPCEWCTSHVTVGLLPFSGMLFNFSTFLQI